MFLIILILCIIFLYYYYVYKTIKVSVKKQKTHKNKISNNCPTKSVDIETFDVDSLLSKLEQKTVDNTEYIYLDIGVNNKYAGKIIIKLFEDVVPKTCNNFKTLCKTKKYKNSSFHRIIKDFMIQGGDFTRGDGTGGKSIYGSHFEDENFELVHDRPYLLSMANAGPNTNGSQFFITTTETPHLDGKHVVFGEVIDGFELIDELNVVRTDANDKPYDNITILDCGIN